MKSKSLLPTLKFPCLRKSFVTGSLVLSLVVAPWISSVLAADGSVVKVTRAADGTYGLERDGKPYYINGTGGKQYLDQLARFGGNSVRTWGIETLEELVDGKPLIKRAAELGLTVTAGIWIEHERRGFNYSDEASLQKQRDAVRAAVRKYKDEPALLLWGLGNEMEGVMDKGDDERIWKELNVLAGIVKEEDPNHPVMTVIAGAQPAKVKAALAYYPNLDILGVNAYAGASGVGGSVKAAGWQKPFVLTEFGPVGHWEVRKTSWGAPIEPTSWDKAANYFATQNLVRDQGKGLCLGSYAFLWGWKQETTATWYGMFLPDGEKLPSVDAISYSWTGHWPPNRSPKIESFESPAKEKILAPGATSTATVAAKDFEGDPLKVDWEVVAESTDTKVGGDLESAPPSFPDAIVSHDGMNMTFRAPQKPGGYRLFVTVHDGKGGASKDNFPFLVK